jgi:hypothetical protein
MGEWHFVLQYWRVLLCIWAGFVCIAVVLSAPIVLLSGNRVRWYIVDILALFVPFAVWLSLMVDYGAGRKSLANLIEPWIIALSLPAAVLIRVAVGKRFSRMDCSGSFLVVLSLVAACIFWCTPALRE